MVYVDRNGQVWEQRPWNLDRVISIFSAIWIIIVQFFTTLIAPFVNDRTRGNGWDSGRNAGNGGSGGGGGGGGGSGGGRGSFTGAGFRPNRRIGRVINTSMDCNIPGGG